MSGARQRMRALKHAGLRFDVHDEGPLDGEVVLLLHGFPERSTCWREVAPLLHAEGYRTVAMDQRGYSEGARPPRRRDYQVTELAGDVEALAACFGGPVHVVGHDWGAVVAWTVAARRPDLVRTLTAVSVPHPTAYLSSVVRSRQFLKSWYMLLFQLPRLPERLARRAGGPVDRLLGKTGMTGSDVERFRDEIVDSGAFPHALGWYRAMPFLDRSLLGRKVTVPTTLVWSDGDSAIDRAGVDRTPEYVDAPYALVVLEGVSHWIPTQAPQALAEAVLARVGAPAGDA